AEDRRRDAWLMENPRQRDLRVIDAALFRQLGHAIDNREILSPVILPARKFIGLRANGLAIILFAAITDHESASQGAEWRHTDTFGAAERQHLPLFLAVDHVVVVLHRDESGEAKPVRRCEHFHEL